MFFWLFAQDTVVPNSQEEAVTKLVTSLIILLLVATSERNLRDLYNQRHDSEENPERDQLFKIRRQLLLAKKGAINDALRKGILSEDLARAYVQRFNRKLLQLGDD